MVEDFRLDELHALIDEALAGPEDDSGPAGPPLAALPHTWGGEPGLLATLAQVLDNHVPEVSRRQDILDALRDTLNRDYPPGDLGSFHAQVARCRRCEGLSPPVALPIRGSDRPDVVLVCEQVPEPKALDAAKVTLVEVGFDLNKIALTYATRCHAPRKPTGTELENCASHLTTELSIFSPKLIIALGIPVIQVLLSEHRLAESHGRIFWIGPWAIMPSYGLGVLTYGGQHAQELAKDLANAKRFCYG